MTDKFETYNEVIQELLSEAISCTPENWTRGVLNITCDGRRIEYRLKNDTEMGQASISDELAQLCEKIYLAFANNGDVWIEANFCLSQNAEGGWRFDTEFIYPE